jgi:hypothetical protein
LATLYGISPDTLRPDRQPVCARRHTKRRLLIYQRGYSLFARATWLAGWCPSLRRPMKRCAVGLQSGHGQR